MSDGSLFYDIDANKSSGTTSSISTSSSSKSSNSDLDKDAFLRLLVTQLQYQDPLDPMDNTEFVSQMAQFTSLEQMNNLNNTMTNSQAYSMIGRTVYAQVYNEASNTYEDIAGTVDSVTIKSNTAYLNVGEKQIPYSDVQEVYSTDTNTSIDRNLVVSQALSLVGKCIQAITFDDDLNADEFIEGKVDYIKFIDDTPILSVGGKDVNTQDIVSVSDNSLLKGQTISAEIYDTETKKNVDITGTVKGVEISGEKIYLNVDGKNVEITDISSVLNALSYIGKDINYKDVSGTVESVVVRDADCYLVVGENEVLYSEIE